ncbi:hypothetical protein [Frankia nepalensis]|nr:hypothetical protein [Frankia nepalensis]
MKLHARASEGAYPRAHPAKNGAAWTAIRAASGPHSRVYRPEEPA